MMMSDKSLKEKLESLPKWIRVRTLTDPNIKVVEVRRGFWPFYEWYAVSVIRPHFLCTPNEEGYQYCLIKDDETLLKVLSLRGV